MQNVLGALRTSELWTSLLAAVLGVLVQQGVITQSAVAPTEQLAAGLIAYVIGRVAHKVTNNAIPFQPKPQVPPR
jgi:predicted membrane channel-forming protein YqfA (hemolysin III family)